MMTDPDEILEICNRFIEETIQKTSILDKEESKMTFHQVKEHLIFIIKNDHSTELKMWKKFCNLGLAAVSSSSLNDMVKIVWRMVKEQGGDAKTMLCYFVIGISAISTTASNSIATDVIAGWRRTCVDWLGKQLTIGGKGVTGEGEGATMERIKRFFNTPYLHDFD